MVTRAETLGLSPISVHILCVTFSLQPCHQHRGEGTLQSCSGDLGVYCLRQVFL